MVSTILVPLDGSDLARHALPFATFLAQAMHARLVLLHAYRSSAHDCEPDPELDLIQEHADLASDLRARGVHAATWLSYDQPGPAIVETASDLGAELIVMSTHGRGGVSQLIYGGVAEHVIRHSPVPVVLVTSKACPRWTEDLPLRILVPLDGSEHSEVALGPARELARALHASLVLLRVPEPPIERSMPWQSHGRVEQQRIVDDARKYLQRVARLLRADGHQAEVLVETGTPSDVIGRVASELGSAVVVMSTHGRGALSRLLLESVAAETLRKLTVPVLLVRPDHPNKTPNKTLDAGASGG